MSKRPVTERRGEGKLLDVQEGGSNVEKSAENSIQCPNDKIPAFSSFRFAEFRAEHEPKLLEVVTQAWRAATKLGQLAKRSKKRKVNTKLPTFRAKRAKTLNEDRRAIFLCVLCEGGAKAPGRRKSSSESRLRKTSGYKCKECSAAIDTSDDEDEAAHRDASPCTTNNGIQIISVATQG